jgi:hypothetical protein
MKIVINSDYGGFGLSEEAIERYIELSDLTLYRHFDTEWKTISYYTVPYDEYEKVHKKDLKEGNYKDSNALCWSEREIPRNDSILVQVVEELGEEVNTQYSRLKVVEIPDDVKWQIDEYDGSEWVAEVHRTWS